ncbi:hypothetical protein [Pectobacterium phage PcaP2EGY]
MYNSRVKQLAYELKQRGLKPEGAYAVLRIGSIALMHGRKDKFVRNDLRVQYESIGGRG